MKTRSGRNLHPESFFFVKSHIDFQILHRDKVNTTIVSNIKTQVLDKSLGAKYEFGVQNLTWKNFWIISKLRLLIEVVYELLIELFFVTNSSYCIVLFYFLCMI